METDNNFKYHFLYSPRTNYNNKLEKERKLFIDLTHSFDPYSIKFLKKHFKEHLGILNKETFICIIKHHLLSWQLDLPHRESIIIKLLSRLFDEIDINSIGEIQWKDFVNYIINISNVNLNEKSLYSLQSYTRSKTNINHQDFNDNNLKFKYMTSNTNIISYCFYIEKYKLLGIAHEGKAKIIFYNAEKRKRENFEIDLMEIQKEINEYEINELNIKADKIIKKEKKEREKKIKLIEKLNNNMKYNNKEKERIPTPDTVKKEINLINNQSKNEMQNINNIKYYPIYTCFAEDYDILFISSTNNKISAWKFNNKKDEFQNINNSSIKGSNYNLEDNLPLYNCGLPQYSLCFDNNLKVLYSGQEDGKIIQWEITSPNPVFVYEIKNNKKYNFNTINTNSSQRKKINLLSLSKIERSLLINENKEKGKKEEEENEEKLKQAKVINYISDKDQKKNTVSCLLLISNLKLLCSSYYSGQIILWDTINKKPKTIYNDQKTIIYQIIYNPINNRIYSCGFEHEIYVYDPYIEDNAVQKIKGHMSSISSISFNKDNNEFISIDIQGIMKIWDSNNFINFQTINLKEDINNENTNNKQKKKNNLKLNSNLYVEALSNMKQIIVYGENNIILFEKGKTLNPLLCDDDLIIGCSFNSYSNELITISTQRIKFWNIYNGKVNKIFEDLMKGVDISYFELDKRKKKCYLGDNIGNLRCFNLINGILLKEFKPHNNEIVSIIHSIKYKILITGSSDLCIRFHSEIDNNDDSYREIYIINNLNNALQEKRRLKHFIFNEDDNMLIISLSNGMISYYDFNYNKLLNEVNEKKDQLVIKRTASLSTITDLPNVKCLFVSYENGERYIITKINNKYYDLLSGERFGIFIEGDLNDIKNNNNESIKKNIIYSSVYDESTNRLIIGDHAGYVTCYNLDILNEFMNKSYNSKKEALLLIQKISIPYIFRIQPYKHSIIHLFIPYNLYPKIFLSVGSDSVVKLFDFEKGEYIESLKQITIKYTPVPVAISYLKENPFGEKGTKKGGEEDYYYSIDENEKKRKEKILQTIQNINNNHKKYLVINDQLGNKNNILTDNNNDDIKEKIIYRCEIEPNIKMPQINYDNAKRNDIINYSDDILEYNAKIKLQSQINGQNILSDRSSQWNYDVDFSYIIRKEKEEFRKLYVKINGKEKEIKDAEKNFQHISITNKNYTPVYLNKLKSIEKLKFSDYIKERLRIINLSDNKKIMIKKEEKEIIEYTENNKYPHNLSPLQKSKSNLKYTIKIKEQTNNNIETLKSKSNNKKKIIPLDLKSLNTIDKNTHIKRNKRIFYNKSLNAMTPTNEFNDIRFLECKNQFDEKYNELSTPLRLIAKNYAKRKLPKLTKLISVNNNS